MMAPTSSLYDNTLLKKRIEPITGVLPVAGQGARRRRRRGYTDDKRHAISIKSEYTMKLTGHCNLYNGDCTFLFGKGYQVEADAPYTAEVFHRFIDLLADNGVDTYLCNPNAQVPWYPSKMLPGILNGYRRGDREFFRGHYPPANATDLPSELLERILDEQVPFLNRYLDLAEAGIDWVEEISKACRRRGVAPWISIRMNDMHGATSWEGSYMNCAPQKEPQYRLGGCEINPRDGVNPMLMSLDYSHPEVRDYYFTMIRELVEDYDYEGLELDWLRCSFCCEPPASQPQIDVMTEWTAEIRKLTQAQARKTGKPYPLGLRIPVRLGLLRTIGLDVKAMAEAGIIDFISPSNYWQTSWDVPYDRLRHELGTDITIYGVIEDAPNWMYAHAPQSDSSGYRLLSASAPLLRGNAAGKLAAGVDGIEQFNFFCTDEEGIHPTAAKRQAVYPALRGIEDLETLRGQSKHYALATSFGHYLFPLFEFAEQVPATVAPEGRRAFTLSMCAEPADALSELVVQLVILKQEVLPVLGISFNGSPPNFEAQPTDELLFPTGSYTHHIAAHQALNYHFKPAQIREGWNEIVVFHGGHPESPWWSAPEKINEGAVCIVSVELAVTSPFTFATDNSSEAYCMEIAKAMSDLHGVSHSEAIDLINEQWQGQSLSGQSDWLYHDYPATWASRIFRRLREGKGW